MLYGNYVKGDVLINITPIRVSMTHIQYKVLAFSGDFTVSINCMELSEEQALDRIWHTVYNNKLKKEATSGW